MKTTYALGLWEDGYCLYCGTIGECVDRLFDDVKNCEYREIGDYTILKIKHPANLTLDWGMSGDCYLLNDTGEIDEKNDEILEKWKIVKLKKTDLKFLYSHH